jgi:hypothetical protein
VDQFRRPQSPEATRSYWAYKSWYFTRLVLPLAILYTLLQLVHLFWPQLDNAIPWVLGAAAVLGLSALSYRWWRKQFSKSSDITDLFEA